jgi:hypothetical protein
MRAGARMVVAGLALSNLGAGATPVAKQGALGAPDEKFRGDTQALEERARQRFGETDFLGLFIDGPKRVPRTQHDDIALIGLRASTIRDNVSVGLVRRGVLVATRLETDETLAALAYRQPDEPRTPTPPRDPATLPKGRSVKTFTLALDQRIPEVRTRPGTYATTLLLFDRRSNQVVTRIDGAPDKNAMGQTEGSPPIELGHPQCPEAPGCPPSPKDSAILLASTGPTGQGAARSWMVHGSYLVPVSPNDVVKPPTATPSKGRDAQSPGTPVAVLPVQLVLSGEEDAAPVVIPMRVPVYQPLEHIRGQAMARGHFSINLLSVAPALKPQSYAAWALSRRQISEPIVIRLATP